MSGRDLFEEWFLSLNRDFGRSELAVRGVGDEYFYTTTQALWEQYQTLAELKAGMQALMKHRDIPCAETKLCPANDLIDCGMVSHNAIALRTKEARDDFDALAAMVKS